MPTSPRHTVAPPVLVNISVRVVASTGKKCDTGDYIVTYNGESKLTIPVTSTNTILCFALDDATWQNVFFVGMTTSLDRADPQLSSYSISVDRRVLICTDVDTETGPFDMTLQWIVGTPVSNDPQVRNKPG